MRTIEQVDDGPAHVYETTKITEQHGDEAPMSTIVEREGTIAGGEALEPGLVEPASSPIVEIADNNDDRNDVATLVIVGWCKRRKRLANYAVRRNAHKQ